MRSRPGLDPPGKVCVSNLSASRQLRRLLDDLSFWCKFKVKRRDAMMLFSEFCYATFMLAWLEEMLTIDHGYPCLTHGPEANRSVGSPMRPMLEMLSDTIGI